jgi:iron complex outermembrane recepter protein
VAALASALIVPAPSSAEAFLEEVIVTAQRRAQNLYEVPISATVASGESLQAVGARDISAVAGFAPNVSFDSVVTQSGASAATSVYIRGIGQSDFLQTTDPGVGLFVDGVYVARAVGSLLEVADVERIEVLRGPQGTLYGRNTVGGAINVISRAPGDKQALTVRATTGSGERLDSFVRIDAPFAEHVRSKLSFATFDQEGYAYRPNAGDRLGDNHSRAAYAQLVYSPDESLNLAFSADYTHVNESGVAATLDRVVQMCPAGVANAIGGCDGNARPGAPASQTFVFNNVAPVNRAAGGGGVGVSRYDEQYIPSDPFINHGAGREASELDLWGASVTLDWKLAAYTLRSISAWRTFDAFFLRDTDASPYAIAAPGSTVDQRQFSQELQLLGAARDERLNWIAGFYYLDEEADDDSDFSAASFDVQSGGRDIINRSAAVFGQATYRLSEAVALTAGARYTDEDKSYIPTQYFTRSVTGIPPAGLVVVPPFKNELDYSRSTYRATLEVTPAQDLLLYASWSTGFKSGGFVQRNQVPRPLLPTFGPETVEVFEVGTKTTALDGRLRLSAAAFTTDYQDVHIRIVEPTTFAPVTSNAGDARIRGLELEFEATPLARLRIVGGVGYLHGRYTRIAPNVPDVTLNSRLTDSPDWSANLSAIGSLAESLSGRIVWSYRSSHFNDAENTPELRQEAFHVLNASASWRCSSCRDRVWSATLGVRNATDERYLISGYSLAVQGPIASSYARPREWFMTLAVDL